MIDSIENKTFSCCIFLGFAKAFDTVDHGILIQKLEHYGISGTALNWFKSYLSDRSQPVSIENELSDEQEVYYGVPQGSVLGPLLFLIYINDILFSSNILNFRLFADDTSIIYSHPDLKAPESTVNRELNKVSDWLIANRLTLNTGKSNFLVIHSKQKKRNHNIKMCINSNYLEEKEYVKYLGVLIDKNLSWASHIQQNKLKISKNLGILAKLRHNVTKPILRNIYNAFILP